MAAPNIVNVTTITGVTTFKSGIGTAGAITTVVSNAASSGKVLKINKGPNDDFDVTISGGHGEAVVPASGKTGASNKIQKVFPTCEIVEVEPIH